MELWIVCAAAFLGGLAVALLGWAESEESFILRKFFGSIIRAAVSAAGVTASFNFAEFAGPVSYIVAFLAGAGGEAGIKRAGAAITERLNPPD